MLTIHADSAAANVLKAFLLDPDTYKVSVEERVVNTPTRSYPAVALKRNEGIWTQPLFTEYGVPDSGTDTQP